MQAQYYLFDSHVLVLRNLNDATDNHANDYTHKTNDWFRGASNRKKIVPLRLCRTMIRLNYRSEQTNVPMRVEHP